MIAARVIGRFIKTCLNLNRKEEEMKKRIIALDDTYTSDDIRSINALLFIASMVMLVMMTIARIGGLV